MSQYQQTESPLIPSLEARLQVRRMTPNSENKPRGLYFSKDLFERLIFGRGLYSDGLIIGGKLTFQNWLSV